MCDFGVMIQEQDAPQIPPEVAQEMTPTVRAFIEVLLARIAAIEAENAELRAKLNRNSTNSSRPPSSDPPSVKPAPTGNTGHRKRGGQPGHPRHERTLIPTVESDDVVIVRPGSCENCGQRLRGEDPDPQRHQVTETPPIRRVVTELQLHELPCRGCGTRTRTQLPAGVPRGDFGPRLTVGPFGAIERAGINRLGVGNERVLRGRLSQPPRPRTVRRPWSHGRCRIGQRFRQASP
jgi:transposase